MVELVKTKNIIRKSVSFPPKKYLILTPRNMSQEDQLSTAEYIAAALYGPAPYRDAMQYLRSQVPSTNTRWTDEPTENKVKVQTVRWKKYAQDEKCGNTKENPIDIE